MATDVEIDADAFDLDDYDLAILRKLQENYSDGVRSNELARNVGMAKNTFLKKVEYLSKWHLVEERKRGSEVQYRPIRDRYIMPTFLNIKVAADSMSVFIENENRNLNADDVHTRIKRAFRFCLFLYHSIWTEVTNLSLIRLNWKGAVDLFAFRFASSTMANIRERAYTYSLELVGEQWPSYNEAQKQEYVAQIEEMFVPSIAFMEEALTTNQDPDGANFPLRIALEIPEKESMTLREVRNKILLHDKLRLEAETPRLQDIQKYKAYLASTRYRDSDE